MDIVRVADKLAAFRHDFPARKYGIEQWAVEDLCGKTPRVWGFTKITNLESGAVLAQACGTRALREPVVGAQGSRDTRDPDRAMTQALGRALGLLGYAEGHSIEGDTDEPDETGVELAAASTAPPAPPQKAESPVAAARRALAGEVPAEPDVDLVSTDDLRAQLNACTPEARGKVRAGLQLAGFSTEIPDWMETTAHQALTDAVTVELMKAGEAV